MIAVQKRSGMKHSVHPDRIATRCGRILRKKNWKIFNAGGIDCRVCKRSVGK